MVPTESRSSPRCRFPTLEDPTCPRRGGTERLARTPPGAETRNQRGCHAAVPRGLRGGPGKSWSSGTNNSTIGAKRDPEECPVTYDPGSQVTEGTRQVWARGVEFSFLLCVFPGTKHLKSTDKLRRGCPRRVETSGSRKDLPVSVECDLSTDLSKRGDRGL